MNPLAFKDFIVVIPIIISFIALSISIKNSFYAKINILNTIQKMMLEKAKDCNSLYHNAVDAYKGRLHIKDAPDIDYERVVKEIMTSIELLNNSCSEYKQDEKKRFFLNQFWIQLDDSLRNFLLLDTSGNNVVDDEAMNIIRIKNTFQDFGEYLLTTRRNMIPG